MGELTKGETMKYTYYVLTTVITGVTAACVWGSAAKYASSTEMISVSSYPSLTMSVSGSTSSFSPSSAPTLPGAAEETERGEEPSTSSSSAPLSPLSFIELSGRQNKQFIDIGCYLQMPAECKEVVAGIFYVEQEQEKLAIVYRNTSGKILGVLIDPASGKHITELKGCSLGRQDFYGIGRTADSSKLVIAAGNTVQVFDSKTGNLLNQTQFPEDKHIVQLLCRGNSYFLLTFSDNSVVMGEYQDRAPYVFTELGVPAKHLALSSDGLLSAFLNDSGSISLWIPQKGKHFDAVSFDSKVCTAFAIENNRLVKEVSVCDITWNGQEPRLGEMHELERPFDCAVSRIVLDAQGRYIAYVLEDDSIQVFDGTVAKDSFRIAETIEDVSFEGNLLKISMVDGRQIRSLQIRDIANNCALVRYQAGCGSSSKFAVYGKQYVVYGQVLGSLFCTSVLPQDGLAAFIQALSKLSKDTYIFLSDLSEYQQKCFKDFSPFTRHCLESQYPFLIVHDDQKELLEMLNNLSRETLCVVTEKQERVFKRLYPAVREKITQDYPLVMHPDQECAQLVRKIQEQKISVIDHRLFNTIPEDTRRCLRERNRNLIINNNRFVRAFWRVIDAVGLGYFSRKTIRISTAVILASALGVGAWRLWVKYHT